MTQGPFEDSGRRRIFGFVAVVLALMLALAWLFAPRGPDQATSVVITKSEPPPIVPERSALAGPDAGREAASGAGRVWLANRIAQSSDLKRTFDEQIASADVRVRRGAEQAFTACIPAFLPASGETPSPEAVIRTLPAARHAEREAAYRAIYARCQGFFGPGRAPLLELQRQLEADRRLRQPGVQATEDLLAGRIERVEPLVTEALSGGDPAAIASLAGLVERLVQRRQDSPSVETLALARAVDAALPWVACELGLGCGVDSIQALQLCAVQGACEGDLPTRLLSLASSDGLDPLAVTAQHARLLALIRSGRLLGSADLLP